MNAGPTLKIPDCFRNREIRLRTYSVKMSESAYSNGRLCIDLISADKSEHLTRLTVNLPKEYLKPSTFLVQTGDDGAEVLLDLLMSGIFIDTKDFRTDGSLRFAVWKFSKGRTTKFTAGEALEEEYVHCNGNTLCARNVPLGEGAYKRYGDEEFLGARLQEAPICPYCKKPSVLVQGSAIFPGWEKGAGLNFWLCGPCDARVGCHDGTPEPFGTLANAELRALRTQTHKALDPLFSSGRMRKSESYKWLAQQLGIDEESCHVGMFDDALCLRTISVCLNYLAQP